MIAGYRPKKTVLLTPAPNRITAARHALDRKGIASARFLPFAGSALAAHLASNGIVEAIRMSP